MPESDDLLIHKTIQGDTGSFGTLVERHHPVQEYTWERGKWQCKRTAGK